MMDSSALRDFMIFQSEEDKFDRGGLYLILAWIFSISFTMVLRTRALSVGFRLVDLMYDSVARI